MRIKIISINDYAEIEWTEIVKAETKSAACKKAWKVLRSCYQEKLAYKEIISDRAETWILAGTTKDRSK